MGLVVFGAFDGHSGGQIALRQLGIKVDKYYASEIDKFAIQQTQHNFPNTIQLGSIVDVDVSKLDKIDLFLGGSPCQSFSFAGKRKGMSTTCSEEIYTLDRYLELKRDGFDFEGQSYLFWEYMRILTDIRKYNPDVKFLLENVEMGNKWERVLSEAIGVYGVHINSALVSAQNRKRIYWSNIRVKEVGLFGELHTDIPQPEDRGILLRDILEGDVDEKFYLSEKIIKGFQNKKSIFRERFSPVDGNHKSGCLTSRYHKMAATDTFIKIDKQCNPKANQNKASCFTAGRIRGGNHSDMDLIVHNMMPRSSKSGKGGTGHLSRSDGKTYCLDTGNTNAVEICVAQRGRDGVQQLEPQMSGKTNALTSVQKDNLVIQLNPSTESGVNQPYQQNRVYDSNGKSPAHMAQMSCNSYAITENYCIRRLTPTEVARLQTVPDWYEWIVSDTQIYKQCGNGWTIEVIMHILQYLKQ